VKGARLLWVLNNITSRQRAFLVIRQSCVIKISKLAQSMLMHSGMTLCAIYEKRMVSQLHNNRLSAITAKLVQFARFSVFLSITSVLTVKNFPLLIF